MAAVFASRPDQELIERTGVPSDDFDEEAIGASALVLSATPLA